MIKKLIRPIFQSGHTFVLGTVGAAKHYAAGFVSVADDTAAAVGAFRREGVDGAFERVEVMRNAILHNFQRLVVFIPAEFAGPAAMRLKSLPFVLFSSLFSQISAERCHSQQS